VISKAGEQRSGFIAVIVSASSLDRSLRPRPPHSVAAFDHTAHTANLSYDCNLAPSALSRFVSVADGKSVVVGRELSVHAYPHCRHNSTDKDAGSDDSTGTRIPAVLLAVGKYMDGDVLRTTENWYERRESAEDMLRFSFGYHGAPYIGTGPEIGLRGMPREFLPQAASGQKPSRSTTNRAEIVHGSPGRNERTLIPDRKSGRHAFPFNSRGLNRHREGSPWQAFPVGPRLRPLHIRAFH